MHDERRQTQDRRTCPTPPLSRFTLRGRRRKARRSEEDQNYYVDRYEFRYLFLIAGILIFCFLDAYLTLMLLSFGGAELNPFMLLLMRKDIFLALIVKYLLTAFCLIFFLMHKNFKIFGRFQINSLIYAVFSAYVILVLFEAFSYFRVIRILGVYAGP